MTHSDRRPTRAQRIERLRRFGTPERLARVEEVVSSLAPGEIERLEQLFWKSHAKTAPLYREGGGLFKESRDRIREWIVCELERKARWKTELETRRLHRALRAEKKKAEANRRRTKAAALNDAASALRREVRYLRSRIKKLVAIIELYLPATTDQALERAFQRALRLRTVPLNGRAVVTVGQEAVFLARLKRVMLDATKKENENV